MNSYAWAQLIALLLTVAILVILIVVLTRNNLTNLSLDTDAEKITALDNKINWLYGLEIAAVGLMLAFSVIAMLSYMYYKSPCA
jgi:hypothetical protein